MLTWRFFKIVPEQKGPLYRNVPDLSVSGLMPTGVEATVRGNPGVLSRFDALRGTELAQKTTAALELS